MESDNQKWLNTTKLKNNNWQNILYNIKQYITQNVIFIEYHWTKNDAKRNILKSI